MNEKQNGVINFFKEASTTIFALGVLGIGGWMISNQQSGNVQLAVISLQLDTVTKTVDKLTETVKNDTLKMRSDIEELRNRVTTLEAKTK